MSYTPQNPNGQALSTDSTPVVIASDQPPLPTQTEGNIPAGVADSGNPVKVGGKYNAAAPTLSDGQRGDIQLDSSGNLKAYLATKLDNVNDSVTNYPVGHAYVNITANATTTVKSGAGVIKAIYINKKGLLGSTATIYDSVSASGPKIGTIDTTGMQGCILNDIAFTSGLTIVTAVTTGGTPADITVAYR